MSDSTPPEAVEPEHPCWKDGNRSAAQLPSRASGRLPARAGGDGATGQQHDITREQPEQDPSAHAPEGGGGVREEGRRGEAARDRQSGQSSWTR